MKVITDFHLLYVRVIAHKALGRYLKTSKPDPTFSEPAHIPFLHPNPLILSLVFTKHHSDPNQCYATGCGMGVIGNGLGR